MKILKSFNIYFKHGRMNSSSPTSWTAWFTANPISTKLKDYINSGCVYSNMNNEWQNPILQLFSTIDNIKATASTSNPPIFTLVFYCNKDQLFFLNNQDNPYFYTTIFPCLFPFESGGYLE